jgi:prevent-host-death family protein
MRQWPVQDAKARFSELLDRCMSEGPQVVTRRGEAAAVFVPMAQWARMAQAARPSLKELLLGEGPRFELDLPPRGRWQRRSPKRLD